MKIYPNINELYKLDTKIRRLASHKFNTRLNQFQTVGAKASSRASIVDQKCRIQT